MRVDAMIIAGGEVAKDLKVHVEAEALIPIGNTIMVDYVIKALKNSPSVDNIVVVGPVDKLKTYIKDDRIELVNPGKNAIESVLKGMEKVSKDKMLLVCTGDIPLLTPEAVEDFLLKCSTKDADLFYSIVPKEINDEKFPGIERTYVKLKDGKFTGGNIILVNPDIIKKCASKGEELVRLRKKPLQLGRLIGISFIFKYIFRLLSISETESKFSKLLGIKGVAVISKYPEVGIDVDKASDFYLVKKILEDKVS